MRERYFIFAIFAIGVTLQLKEANGASSDMFTIQNGVECTDDDLQVQTDASASQDACLTKCLSIAKCFSGTFSGGQCKLKSGYCTATKSTPGASMFTRTGFRKCFMCRSATLCQTTQRTCYTLGKCAKNNGENGIWQQTCDCNPTMSTCCDADYCNCIGDQCSKVNQTTARTPYSEVYQIYSIWHRKVNSGKGIPNPLAAKPGYAAAMPSFLRGRSAFSPAGSAPKWGQGAPRWGQGAPKWGGWGSFIKVDWG